MKDQNEKPSDVNPVASDALLAEFRVGYLWKNLDMSEPESRGHYDSQETLNPCWGSFDSEEEALEKLKEWMKRPGSSGPYILLKTFSSR